MNHLITINPKCTMAGFGRTTTDGVMLLQRRGITTTREYGNAEHRFYVIDHDGRALDLSFCTTDGNESQRTRFFGDTKLIDAQAEIKARTGADLRFAASTLAYCYASGVAASVGKDDVFLSPLRYEAASDTIRHVPTNYCVVAFEDGAFCKPVRNIDRAASFLQPAVSEALRGGFHSCDLRNGDDYCKRRLAWLAGCYVMEQHAENSMTVQVLARDMSTPTRMV